MKIMAIVDRHGLPLSVSTHAADHHEVRLVQLCFDFYMIEAKPENLIGDRAYDSDPLDEELRNNGIKMIAPHSCNPHSTWIWLSWNLTWTLGEIAQRLLRAIAQAEIIRDSLAAELLDVKSLPIVKYLPQGHVRRYRGETAGKGGRGFKGNLPDGAVWDVRD
jgi:hypothetical protein